MSERQEINSGTTAVREGMGFDVAALDGWMHANVEGYEGPLSVEQFKGGQSNPTYKLTTPGRNYVMRRKPPGVLLKSAHAVDREYAVISALGSVGFPVARAYGLCTDESVLGTMFYVMDCVDGRVLWDPTFPGMTADERARHFDSMNETIARLHSVDYAAIGLATYGKPGNYFERQIGRWSRQYQEDTDAGRVPAMDKLVEWLPRNIPAGDETSIVHGDFRCDNMIFDAAGPTVRAVLDWELSTLGHPLADFTYHLMMYRMPSTEPGGMADKDLASLGIPSEADYVAAYCRRTGRDGIPNLDFYMAFNMFRLAAIIHGIKGRAVRGTATSSHAREMAKRLEPMAEAAWRMAVSAGA